MFNQLSRPQLDWASAWQITYYDSLSAQDGPCLAVAGSVLEALDLPPVVPPRQNKTRQRHSSCGFWTMYWAEEHSRRQRGELAWTEEYDAGERMTRLTKFKNRLQELAETKKEEKENSEVAAGSQAVISV